MPVTDKEALQAIQRGEMLNQMMVKRLWQAGYVEVREVTHMQSPEREYIVTFITEKGKQLLFA